MLKVYVVRRYVKAYKTLDVTGGKRKLTSFVTRTVRGPISQLYLRTRNSADSEFEDPHTTGSRERCFRPKH